MGVHRLITLFIIVIMSLTAVAAFPSNTGQLQDGLPVDGCAIDTPNGLIYDRDCDGIDDFSDNCKFTPNSQQSDSNRNGIGDACDLLVTEVTLDPGTEVKQGEFFTVRVQLINNKEYELTDIQARIRHEGLEADVATLIDSLKPGEQRTLDFILKAPGCATPGRYELTFTTDHKEGERVFTQTLYQRITVIDNPGLCTPGATAIDNTLFESLSQQEAEIGDRVIYPIKVTNLNGEAKTYHLALEDINYIGTYRIDPDPTFTIPAGKSETVYLYVQTESFAPVGRNTLHLSLETEGKIEEVTLGLRLIKSVGAPFSQVLTSALQLALVLIVLALIIGAGVVAYKKLNEEHDDEYDGEETPKKTAKEAAIEDVQEDDFQSYY